MSIIGERIKTARLERGINQRTLCELADITETTLSRYENGTREPQASLIWKIAKVLNVTTDYLIGNVDDIKYIERGYEDFEDKLRKIGADIIKAECEKDVRKFEFSVS